MNLKLTALSLTAAIALASCNLPGVGGPDKPTTPTARGIVNLDTTPGGSSRVYKDSDAIGRTVTITAFAPPTSTSTGATMQSLRAGSERHGWLGTVRTERNTLNAQNAAPAVLAQAVLGQDRQFSVPMTAAISDDLLVNVTNIWPEEGGLSKTTCQKNADRISDPNVRIGSADFTLAPTATQSEITILDAEENDTGTSYARTVRTLIYADRDSVIEQDGKCTRTDHISGAVSTLTIRYNIRLTKGWNSLEHYNWFTSNGREMLIATHTRTGHYPLTFNLRSLE